MPKWGPDKQLIGMGVSSIASLYRTVRALIMAHHFPVEQAISLITSNVAKALKLYPRKGALMPGSDADLVLLNEDYTIHQVFALGKTRNRNFYEYD